MQSLGNLLWRFVEARASSQPMGLGFLETVFDQPYLAHLTVQE